MRTKPNTTMTRAGLDYICSRASGRLRDFSEADSMLMRVVYREVVKSSAVAIERTGVDGRYLIDAVADGDYILHAVQPFGDEEVTWDIPVSVRGADVTLDIHNANARPTLEDFFGKR